MGTGGGESVVDAEDVFVFDVIFFERFFVGSDETPVPSACSQWSGCQVRTYKKALETNNQKLGSARNKSKNKQTRPK